MGCTELASSLSPSPQFRRQAVLKSFFAKLLILFLVPVISIVDAKITQEETYSIIRALIAEVIEAEVFNNPECGNRTAIICRKTVFLYDFQYFTCGGADAKGFLPDPWPAIDLITLVDACAKAMLSTEEVCQSNLISVVVPLCGIRSVPLNRQVLLAALDLPFWPGPYGEKKQQQEELRRVQVAEHRLQKRRY